MIMIDLLIGLGIILDLMLTLGVAYQSDLKDLEKLDPKYRKYLKDKLDI